MHLSPSSDSRSSGTGSARRPCVRIVTFGCRVNQYEGDAMRRALGAAYPITSDGADVYVLNACTVTGLADRKARQFARRIRRTNPKALIVIIGCLADAVAQRSTRFDEADVLAGNAWKPRINDVVAAALTGMRGPLPNIHVTPLDSEFTDGPRDRVRAFLKVQDGCSRRCTYCRATQVRGSTRSKSVACAVAETSRLLDLDFPEIVLTGINLAEYAPSDGTLAELLRAILRFPQLRRLRIASLNLAGVDDALLDVCASDHRLCKHFHIPLQSGDDRILLAMDRRHSVAEYQATIDRIRGCLPGATFGTDIIVGFPGESDAAFDATCTVVAGIGFSNLHVFRFSPRHGTAAARFHDAVPENTKRLRAELLDTVWRDTLRRILDTRVGSTQDVLVETCASGRWMGYTRDYLYVSFDSDSGIRVGAECSVRIRGIAHGRLEGVVDNRSNTG